MKLLALDTASDACSVALALDQDVRYQHVVEPRAHGRLLLPMIRDLLEDAGIALQQLDALVLGRGPGSFTGVRIATGVVQGLALGAGLPVIPVSSLAAMAQGARRRDGASRVAVAVDARMQEVYWGVFAADQQGVMREAAPERVCTPGEVSLPPGPWPGLGTGFATYGEALREACGSSLQGVLDDSRLVDARDLLPLAETAWNENGAVAPDDALPVYLRDEVAWHKS